MSGRLLAMAFSCAVATGLVGFARAAPASQAGGAASGPASAPASRAALTPAQQAEVIQLNQAAMKALLAKDWPMAEKNLRAAIKQAPSNGSFLYDLACVLALQDKKAEAVATLAAAAEAGAVNFDRMTHDPDLKAIWDNPDFKKLLARRDELIAAAATSKFERLKSELDGQYGVITKYDKYRLIVVSDLPAAQVKQIVGLIGPEAETLWKQFFPYRPCEYVTLILPSRGGARAGTAGGYDPGTHTITLNIATGLGTVSHEWTHALHFADMEALAQNHPIWIIEGLGSLYEQANNDGKRVIGLLNWRLPPLQKALAEGKLPTLRSMMKTNEGFGSMQYAMSRYVMYYLQEHGQLEKFYADFREHYQDDPTGISALQRATGMELDQFDAQWRQYAAALGKPASKPISGPN